MPDHARYVPGSIDTHSHVTEMLDKGVPVLEMLAEARANGMSAIVDVGLAPDDLAERTRLLSAFPFVFLTSGIHPSRSGRDDLDELLDLLSEQVSQGRVIAVGETGLDYYRDTGSRSVQQRLFHEQLALATAADLPVIIHNREADDDVLAGLRTRRPRGVMHCFSQDPAFCTECLDLGMYISFGGNLTYRTSDGVRAAARIVPVDRLLVETDAPYLSPIPVRGRLNHPGHLGFTIEALAEVRDEDPEALAHTTAENAQRLFGLDALER